MPEEIIIVDEDDEVTGSKNEPLKSQRIISVFGDS